MGSVFRFRTSCLVAGFLSLPACNKEDKDNSVIAVESKVFDIMIQSADPDRYAYNTESALVGQAEDGSETRMLLAIPYILALFREDVVLSSIAHIEIQLFAKEVDVNPDNIQLSFVSQKWTPYATWNSRFSLAQGYAWDTPGGDLMDISPISPDIEKASSNGQDKKLLFNVTDPILEAISRGQTIQGFILKVLPSSDNDQNTSPIFTSNHSSGYAPKAVLTFNKEDILIP